MLEHGRTRKDQIYSSAARLFSERGYHATTVREIARDLQIEGGSLYSHISSKQELLYEIVLRASERFLTMAREVRAGGGTAREQLRILMQRHLQIVAESVPLAAVYFHEWRHLEPEQQATIKAHRDAYESAVRAIVRAGVDRGEFEQVDERLATLQVLSMLNWSYQWYRADGTLTASEIADRFFDLVMCGLEPRRKD
jgi:TetR/AcrR family transcriptional regulator, cholesterol catabolism regulator